MTQNLEQLYYLINDEVMRSCNFRDKLVALAEAKVVLGKRLDELCGEEGSALLDVYGQLESERQTLHEQGLFTAALSLGMELGRLGSNPNRPG